MDSITEEPAQAPPEMSENGRPLRRCARCGQVDDHPRCHAGVIGNASLPPTFHIDCHAALGCPYCLHQLERGGEGLKGLDLVDKLVELGPIPDEKIAELQASLGQGGEG